MSGIFGSLPVINIREKSLANFVARQCQSSRPRHPGEEIAYVIEGTLEYKLDGREPVSLSAGQSLFIPTGVAHSAQNVGTGKASELATYIVQKGQSLVIPSK